MGATALPGGLHTSSIGSFNCAGRVADRIVGRGSSEFGSAPQGRDAHPAAATTYRSLALYRTSLEGYLGVGLPELTAALQAFAPQIKAVIPGLLSASAGVGLAVLQWIFSIVIAGVLLANAAPAATIARRLSNRLFGDRGPEFEELAGATIRSVTTGIIGVAIIQSFFAALGFLVAGMPGAGLWVVIFIIAAVLQLGGLVLIPPVIYMFATASTTKAVIFLVWCLAVGLDGQRA